MFLGVKQLIYVEIMSSGLKDYRVCAMVLFSPYQGCCEILIHQCELVGPAVRWVQGPSINVSV